MCGIAGIISLKCTGERGALQTMSGALRHRGPDGYGYLHYSASAGTQIWLNRKIQGAKEKDCVVGFAHRRLSIIDLSTDSLQPMTDETGKLSVVFNGEIYNYLELKVELESLGYTFRTFGDTEVLLKAYHAWGPQCVQRFNGMWAFVLLDIVNQRVIFSRDRFGIKPLYYTTQNEALYFASEIKALLSVNSISCTPNEKAVARFLIGGVADDSRETFFKGIFQFPAAHWAELSLRELSLEICPNSYWSFPTTMFEGSEQEAIDQFHALFLDAIRVHSRSDVSVGTCLSGGLDSASIVCSSEILRQEHQIPSYSHSAFGYCSSDRHFSEKRFMEMVVKATGVQMHYIEVEPDDFTVFLPKILEAQDEPFGSASIVAQWFVFRSALQQGMVVMLDGQGADEVLGGYHRYFSTVASHLLRKMELRRFISLRNAYEREIGPFPVSFRSALLRLMPSAMRRIGLTIAQLLVSPAARTPISGVVNPGLLKEYGRIASDGYLAPSSLDGVLQRDMQFCSLPALLRYEDRNSMAHSIESRVPFLDYRLVDFAFMLPDKWKIRDVTTKYILRQAMKGILPDTIRNRKDKIGFKPASSLTFDFIAQNYSSLVENKTEYEEHWFDPDAIEQMFNDSDRSVEAEFYLWRIVNTKLWARQFWS